ncbi:hypothetical protein F4811DRAFT_557756 [Daldinia bambusicola]|nr:hypothetical protein F4811DRAFT_557756 [Daldinia bambusicola]
MSSQLPMNVTPIKEVQPDRVCIDSHTFRINYDVPQEITNRFYELLDQDDVKYEDIPDDLKVYEVHDPPEEETEQSGASGATTS